MLTRIEHNFASADSIKNNSNHFKINTQHYWKVDGILSSGFLAKIKFNYDGTKNTSGNSYLDTCLTSFNGDSLILLYRKNAADDWREVTNYSKFKISSKLGFVTADTLKLGEYVFPNGQSSVLTYSNKIQKHDIKLNIFPNPSSTILNITIENFNPTNSSSIHIYDMQGKIVKRINSVYSENTISISDLANGQYIVNLMDKSKKIASKMVVVE